MAIATSMHPAYPPSEGRPAPEALADLLPEARAGSREAAERLLVLILPRVRNLIRYLLRGDDDVDDITQEALSAVFRKLTTYRGEGSFVAWVDRVVVRCTFAHRQRTAVWHKRRFEGDPAPVAFTAQAFPAEAEYVARRKVVELLDALPNDQRIALVMHHVLGMSVPEIAGELSIPEGTVRSRLRLGRSRLRARLSPRGEVVHEDE
jgi:RNA polymerase sigma-70 factor (ECF subfamily)